MTTKGANIERLSNRDHAGCAWLFANTATFSGLLEMH